MNRKKDSTRFPTIENLVIYKLYVAGYIGGRHTSEDNVPKGFPKHMRGQVRDALHSLIKKGVIGSKPTRYGREVFINPKYPDIERILEESVMVARKAQQHRGYKTQHDNCAGAVKEVPCPYCGKLTPAHFPPYMEGMTSPTCSVNRCQHCGKVFKTVRYPDGTTAVKGHFSAPC